MSRLRSTCQEPTDPASLRNLVCDTALIRLHHTLASVAQIGMRLAFANAGSMTPATRAFLIRCFDDGGARFFCLVNRQIAHNKKFFELLLVDLRRGIGI